MWLESASMYIMIKVSNAYGECVRCEQPILFVVIWVVLQAAVKPSAVSPAIISQSVFKFSSLKSMKLAKSRE